MRVAKKVSNQLERKKIMNTFMKAISKIGLTIGMISVVASATVMYASANTNDTRYTLVDHSIGATSYTNFGSHCYNNDSMVGIKLTPVCMYNGLTKARAKIYDSNQEIYLTWNGSDDTASSILTADDYDWVCDVGDMGDHTFTFYVKGVWSSGNFSGTATVV